MILLAAETRKRADVAEATRQTLVALERENWWKGANS
jgi:DNA-binding XRE family transcriptional regulator